MRLKPGDLVSFASRVQGAYGYEPPGPIGLALSPVESGPAHMAAGFWRVQWQTYDSHDLFVAGGIHQNHEDDLVIVRSAVRSGED